MRLPALLSISVLAACSGSSSHPPAVKAPPAPLSVCASLDLDQRAVEVASADSVRGMTADCDAGDTVQLVPAASVTYGDLVRIMDLLVERGLDIELSRADLGDLAPQPMLDHDVSRQIAAGETLDTLGTPLLRLAPGVVELSHTGGPPRALPDLDAALYDALRAYHRGAPKAPGLLIIQADVSTKAPPLVDAATTARAAGFTVLYAVKDS